MIKVCDRSRRQISGARDRGRGLLEQRDHLGIGDLGKLVVIGADRAEVVFRDVERHQLVHLPPQPRRGVARDHRNGDDDAARPAPARLADRRLHGQAGGDAVSFLGDQVKINTDQNAVILSGPKSLLEKVRSLPNINEAMVLELPELVSA